MEGRAAQFETAAARVKMTETSKWEQTRTSESHDHRAAPYGLSRSGFVGSSNTREN